MTAAGKPVNEAWLHSEAELCSQARALSRFNQSAAGLELRMRRLEQEVNELCERQGEATRYPLERARGGDLTQVDSPGEPTSNDVTA